MAINNVATDTRDWVAEFLESYKTERRSPENTTDNYGKDLEQFQEHLGRKHVLAATSRDIAAFISYRLDKGISPISARRQLCAIRSFYGFVLSERAIERDPTRFLRGPKAHRPLVRQVTREEIELLVSSIGTETPLQLRDRAMLLAAYGSNFRVSELISLPISRININQTVATVKRAKNLRDRIVPLNPREIEAIQLYLEKGRPALLGSHPDNGLLFISERGEQMTRMRAWQIFAEVSRRVLGRAVSPHKFRHAFVTDTVNGGADIRVVQRMVGHAYIGTTMLYMHSDIERIRRHYLQSHPLALASLNGGQNA